MYRQTTIKKTLEQINANQIYLPVIQRKFVWDEDRVTNLFDSILRGYPIGTFLFWTLKREDANNNIFYRFIKNYSEFDNYLNELAPFPELRDSIISVLDGQQRLSAIYLALQGTYATRKPHFPKNNPASFPVRQLYLNLMAIEEHPNDTEILYDFRFLSDIDARITDDRNLWFKVRDLLAIPRIGEVNNLFNNTLQRANEANVQHLMYPRQNIINQTLLNLYSYLTIEENICYYEVENPDIDDVLSIFVRINSGGKVLSKTDLLFSTIVANWQAGRQEIENFLDEINAKGTGFAFNNDFFMRACLCLTDLPVLFKVGTFNPENLTAIQNAFNQITNSISRTVDLLVILGFSGETLRSQNAVIPIAYYFLKGGELIGNVRTEIRQYLYRTLLKNMFGSHGDNLLANIRSTLIENGNLFNVASINQNLPNGKSLDIDLYDIDVMLEHKKGNDAFLVLSLLYPNLRFSQVVFHQDHIHPYSGFRAANYNNWGITDEQRELYDRVKDMIPNLQLLEGVANQEKSATPFDQWINMKPINERGSFLNDNFIDPGWNRSFGSFETFFNNRKILLRNRLIQIFNVQDQPPVNPNDANHQDDEPYAGVPPIFPPMQPVLQNGKVVNNLLSEANQSDSSIIDISFNNTNLNPLTLDDPNYEADGTKDEPTESDKTPVTDNLFEKEKLKNLSKALTASEFSFIARGMLSTSDIQNAVKDKYPELCNDKYLCIEHCHSGHNQPEWRHKVRGCLDSLKGRSIYVRKNPKIGFWDLL
jgi:hypothetical protein